MGRSRKRKDQMNKIKRARNSVKELIRLKKTLGLIDDKGNEIIKKVESITTLTTGEEIKEKKRQIKDKDEKIAVVNEKTKVVHVHSTRTLKDQFGNLPIWASNRKSKKKAGRRLAWRMRHPHQLWSASGHVPLD